MAIENQRNKYLTIVSLLAWLLVGCENQKYTQCQEIIAIANRASTEAQKITKDSLGKETKIGNWLQAADIMSVAAKEIESLSVKDPQLIDYQGNLVNIFQVYALATYDAVKARKARNLSALKAARENAQKIGKLNQDVVAKINSYCTAK